MTNTHTATLSELEAYVDDLEARLTAARAGYLANLDNANLKTIPDISTFTSTEIAYIDAKISEVIKQVALTGHASDSIGKILFELENTRLTAARAAFLENIDNANLATIGDISSLDATKIGRLDAAISTAGGSPLSILEFWSTVQPAMIDITNSATDFGLQNVVIPDLGTFTIVKAYAMLLFSSVEDSSGSNNHLDTATFIQVDKAAAGYINAISMVASVIKLVASEIVSTTWSIVGDIDISARVANNATTNFKWTNAKATGSTIRIWGVRTGIRLIVS